MKVSIASTLLSLSVLTAAHPGQSKAEMKREAAERNAYLSTHKRSLAHCADQLKARGNDVAMQNRRRSLVEKARQKRSISMAKPYLQARDVDTVLATDHKSNLTGITTDTDPSILFSSNNSCILTPEVTQGPYWVSGELVRQDMTDGEEGVPLTLDIQIIDVNTCEPVPKVYLEAWHCNSTGVYSGVVANGNGDSSDESNLDATFLRGINLSDDDGVVTFDTVFPGHYTGRATHMHVLSHVGASLNANKTLSGGNITHVGQVFFDQDLISLVETEEPYASNTQEITTNAEDSILAEEAAEVDPMVEYVLLGDSVSDGIFGWIAFGMDTTSSYDVSPAVYYTSEGGVENENSGMGGGGAPPNGTAPTGNPPTGSMPTGSSPAAISSSSSSSASSSIASSSIASSSTASSSPASSSSAGNSPAGNSRAGNSHAGNPPAGNSRAGNAHADNSRAGNVHAGNSRAGNVHAGNSRAGSPPSAAFV